MKKALSLLLIFAVCFSFTPMLEAAKDVKGASDKALEKASEESIFNRTGDWFATIGKPEAEKEKIRAERKAKRAKKRAEKEAKKAKKETEKKAKKVEKKAKKKGKDTDKKAKKAKKEADKKLKGWQK